MTPLGAVIGAGLTATFVVKAVAEALNRRSLDRPLPPELKGLYDPARYERSKDYTRARSRWAVWAESAELAALLVFWWAGGFPALDRWAAGFARPPLDGVLFLGALAFLSDLAAIPFRAYAAFGLEARFGFNRTTVRTFVADRLKGYALAALLGGPIVWAVLMFFAKGGALAWLWAWAAVTLFTLVVQFAAPAWILPLFNRFTPLPEGELRTAIFDLARRLEFPLDNVFVMDGSRRSSKGNAFFTGFGRTKRIALFDTLIAQHTVPELVAVLAHEIGHQKEGHVTKGFAIGVLETGATLLLLSFFLRWGPLFTAFGLDRPSVHAGLALFGVVFRPVTLLLSLPLKAYSRKNEFEADRYARVRLGTGLDLREGLKKLSASTLSNLVPHPLYVRLHYTHPPLAERLKALAD